MTAEQITAKILEVAGPLIVTAIGSLLTLLTWQLKKLIDAKVSDTRFISATGKLAQFTTNAIAEAEQTTVKTLKKDKKWDVETAKTVLDGVVDVVMRHLGERGMGDFKRLGHDKKAVDAMIRTLAEAGLKGLRSAGG